MAQNENENEAIEMSIEGAPEMDFSDMEPEAIEALQMIDEIVRSAEMEAAMSSQEEDPELLLRNSKEEQQNRIEALGRKALAGIGEISDYLNPVHKAGGAAMKPEPFLALSRIAGLTYREILGQRTRFTKIERTLAAQAAELRKLSIDVGYLTNLLDPKNAKH